MKNIIETVIVVFIVACISTGIIVGMNWTLENQKQYRLEKCNTQVELIEPESSLITDFDCIIYHNGNIVKL